MTTPLPRVEARGAASATSKSTIPGIAARTPTSRFVIGDDDFLLDGEPFRVLAGAIHYFRVHPDQWTDRIRKARQMGLNTIETYVPWNAHAPHRGEFVLTGQLNLGRFLDLVAEEGMYAIVRPGPYICAEWAGGGLPAWLFRDGKVGIRRDEPLYMAAVEEYFEEIAPVIVPRQVDQDGPIILVQVENEYGAYGNDKEYLRKLVELNRAIGFTVPLTTVDQPTDEMLANGSLPDLHKTGSFGSRISERIETLRRHQPQGPLMCAEFWDGWFDHWGGHHHVTSAEETASHLDEMLSQGMSVNIYMFHGGTNFGLTNGANDKGMYESVVTSYDYDAPLDESGHPTAKYWAFREVLSKYTTLDGQPPRQARKPSAAITAQLSQSCALWDVADQLGTVSWHDGLPTADDVGHYEGLILYRTEIDSVGQTLFELKEVRDRAQVFLNHQGVGVLERDRHDRAITLPANSHGLLELLVEDQGRVGYGPRLGEPKGLIGPATLNGEPLGSWAAQPLDLSRIDTVSAFLQTLGIEPTVALAGPAFARATFDLESADDLFLDTHGWGKGIVWINGFCLGRYWSRGPQRTLFVPGPLLRREANELIVLELNASSDVTACFVPAPVLGHSER